MLPTLCEYCDKCSSFFLQLECLLGGLDYGQENGSQLLSPSEKGHFLSSFPSSVRVQVPKILKYVEMIALSNVND